MVNKFTVGNILNIAFGTASLVLTILLFEPRVGFGDFPMPARMIVGLVTTLVACFFAWAFASSYFGLFLKKSGSPADAVARHVANDYAFYVAAFLFVALIGSGISQNTDTGNGTTLAFSIALMVSGFVGMIALFGWYLHVLKSQLKV